MAKAITAYCMATEKKGVPMVGKPTINKLSNGAYMAMGEDKAGHKMSAIMSAEDAKAHVKNGTAKKGKGW